MCWNLSGRYTTLYVSIFALGLKPTETVSASILLTWVEFSLMSKDSERNKHLEVLIQLEILQKLLKTLFSIHLYLY